jgi:hypothetical protein
MDMTTQQTESAEDSITLMEESLSQRGFSFAYIIEYIHIFTYSFLHINQVMKLRSSYNTNSSSSSTAKTVF